MLLIKALLRRIWSLFRPGHFTNEPSNRLFHRRSPQSQSVYSDSSKGQFVDDLGEVDSSVLETFVTAMNNHQVQAAPDLFNDAA